MSTLLDQFFAQYPERDPDVEKIVRAYVADWELPSERLSTLPHDVLVFGGNGAGKSTFARNWLGNPQLLPVAGEISQDQFNAQVDHLFAQGIISKRYHHHASFMGGNTITTLQEFAEWAGVPLILDVAALSRGAAEAGFGRELDSNLRAHFSTQARITPLRSVHLFFCNPLTGLQRVFNRNTERGETAPVDARERIVLAHRQNFYLWPVLAQKYPRVLVWDSSGEKLKLMGMIENPKAPEATASQPAVFHRQNEAALNRFGLTRGNCFALWRLARDYKTEYQFLCDDISTARQFPAQSREGVKLLNHLSVEDAIKTVRAYLTMSKDGEALARAQVSLDAFAENRPLSRTLCMKEKLPRAFRPYQEIDASSPWRPQVKAPQ